MTDQLPLDDLTITASAQIRRKSAEIGQKFHEAFSSFADVHRAINHCNPISHSDMERTRRTLQANFNGTLTKKILKHTNRSLSIIFQYLQMHTIFVFLIRRVH